jgi:plastocyanin
MINKKMKNIITCFMVLITISACKKHNDGTRNDNEIWLHDQTIEPYQTKITKGTTITFINKDPKTHTVSEFNKNFYSGNLKPNDSFSFTFNDTGYYAFYCNYHNSMVGQIIVK